MLNKEYYISSDIRSEFSIIKKGCNELLVEEELINKIARNKKNMVPLRIKLGLDPTAPDIHLGHTVVLNKLRQLQDLGHKVIFLIGDFTATIGDPSGRKATRPSLDQEQVEYNAATYCSQAYKILNPDLTEIRYNSEWFDKLGSRGIVKLSASCTLARILERDDFTKRFKARDPISIHEFLYPIMQGYDSVALKADMEIGGTDQKFNLLMGREIQKENGQEQQSILTMPLLIGIDGVEKMSKSKGNYIGVEESSDSMFGKLMSISDNLMWHYFDLLSFRSSENINIFRKKVNEGMNPRDIKVALAKEIVTRFHSNKDADQALLNFDNLFRNGGVPSEILEINLGPAPINIIRVLRNSGLVASASEAQRMIEQKGIKVNGDRIESKSLQLSAGEYIIQVGKRKFIKVLLT
ncbi:tyrosyl-tRNA synthetase [Candidatus Kinetoplastibacterium blastocrithidii TCC012E]|uniref:Tyrosine--tRNA ligase n=1 Tax=Candidatus Kinetoplastidibacterium blastocrithidiae TCC012E TaxID=1208922 RepID=M1M4K2_9PROT|nr:tyrosine--tRNA ligase [Candidatus Kinetoplastibacterium blastocrithidii]AGF50024.1 tyrosyl-tRNA synthetase [Candidatus Kinetoplastibacterium blastocrithidii TCC012E]